MRQQVETERLLKQAIEFRAIASSKQVQSAENNLPDGLVAFEVPLGQRDRRRTTNGLRCINREIKLRPGVASALPNTASCLRPFSALLAECDDEDLITDTIYLNFID